MEVQNPRRILAVSLDESADHLSNFIKDLTGTLPEPPSAAPVQETEDSSSSSSPPPPPPSTDPAAAEAPADSAAAAAEPSLAGTTHHLPLKTPYYTARVPVWLDLVPASSPADWASAFLAPEAAEVRAALGGLVVVVHLAAAAAAAARSRELLAHAARLVEKGLGGWGWDGVGLAVVVLGGGDGGGGVQDEVVLEEWEDLCARGGLEMVRVGGMDDGARNEFGEKTGIPRVLEALEANDWSAAPSFLGAGGEFDDDDDEEEADFGEFTGSLEDDDLEDMNFGIGKDDLAELRKAIWNAEQQESHASKPAGAAAESTEEGQAKEKETKEAGGGTGPDEEGGQVGDDDLQKLEGMMRKLQAVRDMSAGLPEDQRRRMAARAVGEVMRDL